MKSVMRKGHTCLDANVKMLLTQQTATFRRFGAGFDSESFCRVRSGNAKNTGQ